MTTPQNQPTEAEQAIKDVVYWNKILSDAKKYQAIEDVLKAEPELEKAIEELSSFGKDEVVTQDMIDVCKSLDIVLNAAKRLKEVEEERDELKTRSAAWAGSAGSWAGEADNLRGQLSQLRIEYKQALEALSEIDAIASGFELTENDCAAINKCGGIAQTTLSTPFATLKKGSNE